MQDNNEHIPNSSTPLPEELMNTGLNPKQQMLLKGFNIIKNKYFITSILFLSWILFFAENDIFTGFKRKAKVNNLQKSEKQLSKIIAETNTELSLLKTSAETIEKYARENYLMKKDNEDIFIVSTVASSEK
jgi:cell division protein DivIC